LKLLRMLSIVLVGLVTPAISGAESSLSAANAPSKPQTVDSSDGAHAPEHHMPANPASMPAVPTGGTRVNSAAQHYILVYRSELAPLAINRMHSWVLMLTEQNGEPVVDATITADGGMPLHNHGLPTAPRVRALGEGRYAMDGVRFHMAGEWKVVLEVSVPGHPSDSFDIAVTL